MRSQPTLSTAASPAALNHADTLGGGSAIWPSPPDADGNTPAALAQDLTPSAEAAPVTGKPMVAIVFGWQEDDRAWRLAFRRFYRLVHYHGLPVFRLDRRRSRRPTARLARMDRRPRAVWTATLRLR